MTFGSVRHSREIAAPADAVWALVGDPTRLTEWFPGIAECTVEGDRRTVRLAVGLTFPEQITVCDAVQRRFQYRITSQFFAYHCSTLDVLRLDDRRCLVSYAADADPRTMALVIAGAAAEGLDEVARRFENAASEKGPH